MSPVVVFSLRHCPASRFETSVLRTVSLPVKMAIAKYIRRSFVGLATVAVITFAWRAFAGNMEQRLISPDNNVVAEVRQYTFRAATDAPETEVQVGSRFHLGSDTVFDGLSYGAEIRISWVDAHTLLIRCGSCNQFHIVSKEDRWHQVAIQYHLE